MRRQVPLTAVVAVALVIGLAVAYLALVRPTQERGARLDAEIADLEARLGAADGPRDVGKPRVEVDVADVVRLAKAMPDADDMPGVILELNSLAISTGIRFVAIQPQQPVSSGSYYAVPVTLTFDGDYEDLADFLSRLHELVAVRDGVLDADGRLYTVDAIDMHESPDGFPRIEAVVTVSAYSYGAADSTAAASPATTGTTQTTTTQTTTTAPTTTAPTPPAPSAMGRRGSESRGGNG